MTARTQPATPPDKKKTSQGAIAQLGERLPCTQEVVGSIPSGSTIFSKTLLLANKSANEKENFSFEDLLLFNNLEISDVLSGL